jgi:signal transduction histidine kinase
MVHPLVVQNGNTLTIEGVNETGQMFTDQTKLRQVLLNVLSNAAKFTHHGSIRFVVSQFRSEDGRHQISFIISDSGIGISAEYLPLLFTEFTQADPSMTRKYGGTGLGLAISQRLCQILGGEITIVSESGHGTTCTVRLPVALIKSSPHSAPVERETHT